MVATFDFGPSEESIKALRAQEERIQKLQRDAEIARSKAEQERVQQERDAKSGLTKAEKEIIKQLEKERQKIEQVTQALKFRNEQLLRDEKTQELYNQLQSAGVDLKTREGQEIQRLVEEYYRLRDAKEEEERVIVLAAHEVEEIEDILFNDETMQLDGNGAATSEPYKRDGTVYASIYKHLSVHSVFIRKMASS